MIGMFRDRDSNVFFRGFDVVEQAKLDTGSVLGKDGKVDAISHPRRAEWIRMAQKGAYRSHKCAAHLSGIESALANTNGDINGFKATRGCVALPKLTRKNTNPLE
jgi:hypothetical protein